MDEVTAWHNRPLEPYYPVVFMDAIRVNIRSDGAVSSKAIFVALAILPDGTRDVPGLWFQANEGAKFWARVLNDLRNRGVQDILIAVVDGLKGFTQAIEAELAEFENSDLAAHYTAIAPGWRRAWTEVIPFLDYPPEVRRLIYTTNAIEPLNSKICRAVRTRGHFPRDEAVAKLIYLALNATSTEWKRSGREWHAVKSQLAITFEDRFPMA